MYKYLRKKYYTLSEQCGKYDVCFFCLQAAKRASVAAEPLAAWVKANVQFSYVLERIEPLENEQNELIRSGFSH